ncbi:MAG: amidohydrolase [Pirellulaceae bacterium]|nr:amidohydrolase [Pirellulaceae bacterium]MDP7014246.1 amidohydrolase [Pirellulaceae bacterium]
MSIRSLVIAVSLTILPCAAQAQDDAWRPTQQTAIDAIDRHSDTIRDVNRSLWQWAEVGLEEHQSSKLLQSHLREAGFDVKAGLAGMPTAFVASYGKGKPVIGILAEYDALPGMSQQVEPRRTPRVDGAAGHACGHSGLGSGAMGAALAVKEAIDKHEIAGTVRLYGTPAEETVIGKVYMTLGGVFDDLDFCLHWHPSTKNGAWASSSKALVSAKFTFDGTAAHASVSPESGRSALDAVELMNVGANFMREHLKEDARIHYVVTDGGGAPNVVPPKATVWYFVRADAHQDVEYNFRWLKDIAKGAALMTRTKLAVTIDTDCHEIVPNAPLATQITTNLRRVGAPRFSDEEKLFARRLQEPLIAQFGSSFDHAIDERVHEQSVGSPPSKGSTDVGDISWRVPTGGLRTSCMASGSPGHSWQNVAAIGSTIGEKGTIYAAKALAVTALDLLENPELAAAARADWQVRMKGRKYFSFIPPKQKAPAKIR